MINNNHIKVENLNVFYGKHHVLKNINIKIPDKKITVVIGPSGCGKSTFLKSLNRMLEINTDVNISGNVFVDNENIYGKNIEVTHLRKKMGLLLQKPYPLPMSIYDNIAFGPRIHGIKKKNEIDNIVEYQLKEVNLWDEVKNKLKKSASCLSLGQQQRLCLARGLAVEPEIILCDEPTSSLDPLSSKIIEDKFIQLKTKYTIILVTHILRQAKRIADYVVFMYNGKIIEDGIAEQIFEIPQKEITVKYLKGIIN